MRFPEALCVRDALLGGGRSCFLVAICVGNAFGSVEMVAGRVFWWRDESFGGGRSLLVAEGFFFGGGRSLLVAKGVFWWREVFFWWREESFGGERCFLVA
jgi:hypothetical protein